VSANGYDRASVEQVIVETLRGHERIMSPVTLIDQLVERGLAEDIVRAAMWSLIDQRRIDLMRDRKLVLAQTVRYAPTL